jgi:predicted nucleic acid-binding protein
MTHGIDTSFLVAMEVKAHVENAACHNLFQRLAKAGDTFALAPQVLAEFIHTVTDPRRFATPLTQTQAVARANAWWNAAEVVHVFPSSESTVRFLDWLDKFKLGRKRLNDTLLAATYLENEINSILTLDRDDFFTLHKFTFPK